MLRDDRSKTLAIGGGLLLVNTAYLAAFATPSLFYYANVALHVLLGVVLLVIGARWARRQTLSMTGVLAALILGVGALLGLALTVTGATRSFRWLLLSHIAVTTTGAVLAVALMLRHAHPPERVACLPGSYLCRARTGRRTWVDGGRRRARAGQRRGVSNRES